MNKKEYVLDYITQNKDALFDLIKQYIDQRDSLLQTESQMFHDELKQQCKDICSWIISSEISKNGSVTVEESMILLSELNLNNIYPESFK